MTTASCMSGNSAIPDEFNPVTEGLARRLADDGKRGALHTLWVSSLTQIIRSPRWCKLLERLRDGGQLRVLQVRHPLHFGTRATGIDEAWIAAAASSASGTLTMTWTLPCRH